MNPNKDKFINNLKTGLPALNVIKPSIGGSVASLALNKMAPTQNPSATSPAKDNYIKQVQQYNSPAGPQLPQANPTKPLVGNTSGISQVKSLSTPSAQSPSELYKAQLAVDQFNAAKNRGMEGINQKVIPLEFQTGQKSALERDSAFTGTELETRLARLQAKDEADRKAKQQEFENNLALRKLSMDVSGLLSIQEAKALGVPYGTTRSQAIGKRSLSAKQLESQNDANSALLSLKNLTNLIANDSGGYNSGKLFNLGLGRLGQSERELRDVITRLRTGAALSATEESFYKKQIPRAIDDDATIQQKINQLSAFYSGISGNSVTIELPDGQIVVADDLFDPDTRTELRQAIADGANVITY